MTWAPRYLVRKAPGVDGPPIPEDEPCLVIRGQDPLAVPTITAYIDQHRAAWRADETDPVVTELERHRDRLIEWQAANPGKLKRPDR